MIGKSSKFISPQEEREALWTRQNQLNSASIPGSGREDLMFDQQGDTQVYEGELSRLRKENNTLKEALTRSNRELKSYQIKYPSPYSAANAIPDDSFLLPQWSAAPDVLSPLFEAYDTMIRELQSIMTRQASELDLLREKVAGYLAENDSLRQAQLEFLRQKQQSDGPLDPLHGDLIRDLNERLEILMAENAMLVEQKALLSHELDSSQTDLHTRTNEVEDLTNKLKTIREQLSLTQARFSQAEKERDEAAKQAVHYSVALGKTSSELEAAKESASALLSKCKDVELVAAETQKQLKQLQSQYEDEQLEAMRRVKRAEERVRELHSQLLQKSQELDTVQETARKLKREFQSTRQDAEGMLQVISSLERQIAEYSNREAEVLKQSKDCKERVEDALSSRDQALVREEQCKRDLNRMLEERTKFALRRQNDIDAAVDLARQRAAEQFANLERDIRELAEKNAQLKVEFDRALRDGKSHKEQLEKVQRLQENERAAFESATKELSDKLNQAVINKEEEVGRRHEIQELNKEYRTNIDKLRSQVDTLKAQAGQVEGVKEAETAVLKATVRDLQRDLAEKTRIAHRAQKEAEDGKENFQQQLSSLERKMAEETSILRRRAQEADRTAKEFEQAASTGGQRSQQILEQMQEKTALALQQAQTQLNQEGNAAKSLTVRNRELDHQIRELGNEKSMLMKVVDDAKSTIEKLKAELQQTRGTVSHLTGQLAHSYTAREEGAERAARMIESIQSQSPTYRMQAWTAAAGSPTASTVSRHYEQPKPGPTSNASPEAASVHYTE